MKVLLFLLSLTLVFSFKIKTVADAADGKVVIDLYYESLCPACEQFLQTGVKTALGTKDIWKIGDVFVHPYGNARTIANGSSWSFTCQHGVRECEGNMIELCAINQTDDYYGKALPFIVCLQSNTANWNTTGSRCASQYGLNWASISTCAYGPQGIRLHYEQGLKTNALVPAHSYVPWIVFNGTHNSNDQNAIRTNLVKFICNNYKGSIKIDACK